MIIKNLENYWQRKSNSYTKNMKKLKLITNSCIENIHVQLRVLIVLELIYTLYLWIFI